ncbi:MAG: polyprenyl synthetase family protein [Planctomycetota bacterium]
MRVHERTFSAGTSSRATRREHWSDAVRGLDALDSELRAAVVGTDRLGRAGLDHVATGGKRLRGRLALAAGLGLQRSIYEVMPIAVAVELLHNASLVHDDLQDADRERRGAPTVWAKYDKPTALLLGDTLIARSFGELAKLHTPHLGDLTRSLADCVSGLARGQCSDGAGERDTRWTVEAYEELARAKTGLLFALPVELVCMHARPTDVEAAGEAFRLLGVAFQIFDDLADVCGTKGRAVGSDLRCRRFSAVVLHHRLALEAELGPRPRSTSIDDLFDRVPVEEQARYILGGPGVTATLRHQEDVLRRAAEAARPLADGLSEVLADLGTEVRRATDRLAAEHASPRARVPLPQLQR